MGNLSFNHFMNESMLQCELRPLNPWPLTQLHLTNLFGGEVRPLFEDCLTPSHIIFQLRRQQLHFIGGIAGMGWGTPSPSMKQELGMGVGSAAIGSQHERHSCAGNDANGVNLNWVGQATN
jgi:hypothetical protein